MRCGSMRQRLQLQTPAAIPDGMGGQTNAWTVVATVWGMVGPISGREQLQADQVTALLTHEIDIRYRPGVVPKMRIVRVAGGQVYEIHSIVNLEMRNRQLTLLCSELQVTGA